MEREVLEEMAHLSRQEPTITRVGSIRKKASSVPTTPSTPIVNEFLNFHDGGKLIIAKSGQFLNSFTLIRRSKNAKDSHWCARMRDKLVT